jgi:hypothetical protein
MKHVRAVLPRVECRRHPGHAATHDADSVIKRIASIDYSGLNCEAIRHDVAVIGDSGNRMSGGLASGHLQACKRASRTLKADTNTMHANPRDFPQKSAR